MNSQLETTQNRISTGLKVSSAKDGAAAWAAASTLRSEVKTNQALKDGIGYYISAANTASAAAESIVEALNAIKTAVTAYGNTSNTDEQATYVAQAAAAQKTILTALAASKTGDLDWLSNDDAISVNVGINGAGAVLSQTYTPAVDLEDLLTNSAVGTGVTAFMTTFVVGDLGTAAKIKEIADKADTLAGNATTIAANLGALSSNLTASQEFLSKINDIKSSALSNLVDADMEEESTRLSALQVQQQLATQAISIANSSAQNVLRVFQ